jgi:hypothetical protein
MICQPQMRKGFGGLLLPPAAPRRCPAARSPHSDPPALFPARPGSPCFTGSLQTHEPCQRNTAPAQEGLGPCARGGRQSLPSYCSSSQTQSMHPTCTYIHATPTPTHNTQTQLSQAPTPGQPFPSTASQAAPSHHHVPRHANHAGRAHSRGGRTSADPLVCLAWGTF